MTIARKSALTIMVAMMIAVGRPGSGAGPVSPKGGDSVSLLVVVGAVPKFEGRCIRTIGVVDTGEETDGIYPSDWHHRVQDTASGLAIDWRGSQWPSPKDRASYNGQAVIVEGCVSARRGHEGEWAGTLQSITRLSYWPPRPKTN